VVQLNGVHKGGLRDWTKLLEGLDVGDMLEKLQDLRKEEKRRNES